MADFGICENPDCKLSYDSLILAGLFGRIDAVNGMEKRKVDFSQCSNASCSSSGCESRRWSLPSCHRSYTWHREG
jgi:hypothetical protein